MNNLVSVIIPIYNVETYLERCLLSVINQTYKNLEIILVDDGSKDGSLKVARDFEKRDSRIRVYTKENGGLSDARNFGIKKSSGTYLIFIDSDDFVKVDMVEKMLEKTIETQADVCVCDMKYLYDDLSEAYASGGTFTSSSVKEDPNLIKINNSACNKLYLRTLFYDIDFPFGKYYEDLATIPIILFKAKRVVKVDESFYIYYQRKGSIAHSANKKIFEIYEAINRCIVYVETRTKDKRIIDALYSLYIIHGLDLTSLRIKDFDEKNLRKSYLKENMSLLKKYYSSYKKDVAYKSMPIKKKIIFWLLDLGMEDLVLKIYDK